MQEINRWKCIAFIEIVVNPENLLRKAFPRAGTRMIHTHTHTHTVIFSISCRCQFTLTMTLLTRVASRTESTDPLRKVWPSLVGFCDRSRESECTDSLLTLIFLRVYPLQENEKNYASEVDTKWLHKQCKLELASCNSIWKVQGQLCSCCHKRKHHECPNRNWSSLSEISKLEWVTDPDFLFWPLLLFRFLFLFLHAW